MKRWLLGRPPRSPRAFFPLVRAVLAYRGHDPGQPAGPIAEWLYSGREPSDLDAASALSGSAAPSPRAGDSSPTVYDHGPTFPWTRFYVATPSPELTQIIAPWGRIGHSEPEIKLKAVDEALRTKLSQVLARAYGSRVWDFEKIRQVDEHSSSLNFRVPTVDDDAYLLRIHQRVASTAPLEQLHTVHRLVHAGNIFPRAYTRGLVPIKSDSGGEAFASDGAFVTLYPFVDRVTHFCGRRHKSTQLATSLGQLQKLLASAKPRCNELELCRNDLTPVESDDVIEQRIRIAKEAAARNPSLSLPRLIVENLELIEQAQSLAEREEYPPGEHGHILRDVHPHNTFWDDERCVLIYDYECLSTTWREEVSVAYAAHRFCREEIRDLRDRGHPRWQSEGLRKIDEFVATYEEARGAGMGLDRCRIGRLVLMITLRKLNFVLQAFHRITTDPRPVTKLEAEARKFLMLLKEGILLTDRRLV